MTSTLLWFDQWATETPPGAGHTCPPCTCGAKPKHCRHAHDPWFK